MSTFQFVHDAELLHEHEGGLRLRTADGAVVQLRACAEGVVEVRCAWHDADALDQPPFSYAVLDEALALPDDAQVSTVDQTGRIATGGLTCVADGAPLRLHFEDEDGHTFAADSFGMGRRGAEVGCWKRRADGERFFGLGEHAAPMERTGRTFAHWNTDHPFYDRETRHLYQTHPFYLALYPTPQGRRAYGLFFDNSFRSHFDFSGRADGHVSFRAEGGELRYYVLAGPTPADVLRRYTTLVGRTPMPPAWALGFQQCRWSYYPREDVEALVQQFRDRDLPLDAVHLDIHYMDAYRVGTWHPKRFPAPGEMHERMHEQGVRTVAIVDPGVKKDEEDYPLYRSGNAGDHFVRYPDGEPFEGDVWPGRCRFPDFTSEATRRWFGEAFEPLAEAGVSGYWTDMNEPAVFGGKTMPTLVRHALEGRGGDHAEAHNVYGMQMARSAREAAERLQPDARPFVLTRAGFAGVQRYAAVWTGDNVASWEHLRLGLQMLLALSASGVPFCGTDVGGFRGEPSPELYVRWMQLGAVSPFFRVHSMRGTRRREPWSFGHATERLARRALRLRYRLLPLLYSLFDEHRRTGLPPMRPLFLYETEEALLGEDDLFLLGRDVLAAPVLYPGRRYRRLGLPQGRWYDLRSGKVYEGGSEVILPAPMSRMPLLARAGAVVPLGPPRLHTGEPIDRLSLRLFPGEGRFTLYEDDGQTHAHENGTFRCTHLLQQEDVDGWTLTLDCEGDYDDGVSTFQLVWMARDRPASITVDGEPRDLAPLYDAERRRLTLDVPATCQQVRLRR